MEELVCTQIWVLLKELELRFAVNDDTQRSSGFVEQDVCRIV